MARDSMVNLIAKQQKLLGELGRKGVELRAAERAKPKDQRKVTALLGEVTKINAALALLKVDIRNHPDNN